MSKQVEIYKEEEYETPNMKNN